MNEEIWKDITEFEGYYQVSNLGRVKSLNYRRTGKEQILKPIKNNDGYLQVELYKNGKQKKYYVHRLVWETFVGKIPEGYEINHKSEKKYQNNLENLELVTHKENTNYGSRNERMGEKHNKSILQLDFNDNLIKEWESATIAGNILGIHQESICKCCKGRLNKTGGYKWKYA